ncbi:MAG: carboxypeptidase regulatory-like domain-containing protein, partial [Burkholderiales bacterium]
MKRVLTALALAACGAVFGPATAGAGELRYACGGIGADERRAMRSLEADASVKLLFVTEKRGGWLADVPFVLSSAQGRELLRATSDGPICLLGLPAGRYRVSAEFGGAK